VSRKENSQKYVFNIRLKRIIITQEGYKLNHTSKEIPANSNKMHFSNVQVVQNCSNIKPCFAGVD